MSSQLSTGYAKCSARKNADNGKFMHLLEYPFKDLASLCTESTDTIRRVESTKRKYSYQVRYTFASTRNYLAVVECFYFPLNADDYRKILKGNTPLQGASKARDIKDPDFPDSTSNNPSLVVMKFKNDRLLLF